MDFIYWLVIFYVGAMVTLGLDYCFIMFYCWKNKGNCSVCNNWDCPRGCVLEREEKKERAKNDQ